MKNAADQLKLSDSFFRSLFESSPFGMIIYSASERVAVSVNEAACKLLGYPVEEMLGSKLGAITCHDDLLYELTVFQRIVNKELSTSEIEIRYLNKRGAIVWAKSSISILQDEAEENSTEHVVIVMQDISELKKRKEELQEIEQRYKWIGEKQRETEEILKKNQQHLSTVVNNAPLVLFSIDTQGIFTLSVGKGLELLGLQPNQVVGLSAFDVYSGAPELVANLKRALDGQTVRFVSTLGSLFFDAVYGPLYNAQGEIVGATGIGFDVTGQKIAEQSLSQNEQRLSVIFNSSPDMLMLVRVEQADKFICETINSTYLGAFKDTFPDVSIELIGSDRGEILAGCGLTAEMIESEMMYYRQAVSTKQNVIYEYKKSTTNGYTFHEVSIEPILDQNGACTHLLWGSREITARKKMESELELSEERLRLALQAANQGIYDLDLITGEAIVTDEYSTMLGHDPLVFKETNTFWKERLHPEDRERVSTILSDYLKGVIDNYKVEFRQLTKSGAWKWILSEGKIVKRDGAGKPLRMIGTHTDISLRKKADFAIEKAYKELKEIIDALDQSSLVSVTDKVGTIVKVNRRFCEVARFKEEELLGKNHRIINSGYHDKEFWSDFWKTVSRGEVWHGEIKNKAKDGAEYWVDTVVNPIRNERSEITHYLSIRQDITDRKEYEKLLLLANSRLKENQDILLENEGRMSEAQRLAKLGYWDTDLKTGKAWWSDEQYKINGVEKSDLPLTRETFFNLVHPEDRSAFMEILNKATPESSDFEVDFRIAQPSGKIRFVQGKTRTVFNELGQIIKQSGICLDITDRLIIERTLKESEESLRKAQRVAKIGSWKLDVRNDILDWSDEAYAIFNVPAGQKLTYEDFLSYVHPEDKENVDKAWTAALSAAPYDIVHRIIVNNKIKWVREQAELTFDEYSNLTFGFGTVQDITDQKNLQDSNLIFSESQLLTGIGSWRWILRSNELFWSDNLYTLYGLKKEKTKPSFENYINSIYSKDRERVRALIEKSIANKEPFEIESRVENNMGNIRWIVNKGNVLTKREGEAIEIYGIVRDITAEKLSTEELIEARKRAEEALLVKDEFLSIMSHEVRTPLNSVIGLSNLLLRRTPREDQLEIMKTLKGSADNLLHLVNDILDFSKIRAGKVEVESQLFELDSFLNQLHASFNPLALDKGLEFTIQSDPLLPKLLIADVTRLNQIFNNLIGNAIKFTRQGHVRVGVNKRRTSDTTCTIIFSVEDTGIGILPDKLETIFLPFQQSERDMARKFGGTGLGLTIVKALVGLLEGKIDVTSEHGKGSVFTVELELPFSTSEREVKFSVSETVQSVKDIIPARKLNVLYVEDVESNRFLIENLLLDNAIDCFALSSGSAALKFTKLKKFDLILMDIQMPVMDGYQTTDRIRRQEGGKNKNTPIIAFTAESYSEDLKSKVIHHHMQDVISKPFDMDVLLAKINLFAKPKGRDASLFSFLFYENAFDCDVQKLGKIKKAVISDVKRFEKKLTASETSKNMKTVHSEVHRIRPIIKNLACKTLLIILEDYKLHETYSAEVKIITRKTKRIVKQLLTQLSKLKY